MDTPLIVGTLATQQLSDDISNTVTSIWTRKWTGIVQYCV